MKRFIPLITTLFCCLIVFSQNVTIKGNIIASSDGLPVKDVNISVKGKTIGTSSNEKGNFILKNVSLPCDLKISHIAYLSKEVSLTKKDISKKNTINLNISLADKTTPISEIIIRTKPYYMLERLVYDFEIDDNYLYIISNKNDKKQLSVYTFEDFRKRTQEIPKECNEVSFDSYNKLRVKNNDKNEYYKLLFDKNFNISLEQQSYDVIERGTQLIYFDSSSYSSISKKHFGSFWLAPYNFAWNKFYIIPSFDENMFFFTFWNKNNTFLLYLITKENERLEYKVVYYTTHRCGDWFSNYGYLSNIDDYSILKSIKDNFAYLLSLGTFYLYGKLPLFIKVIDNNLYLLNFDVMKIYKVDNNGVLVSTIEIDDYFANVDYIYLNDVILNQDNNKVYVRYQSSKTTLKELDLTTGKYIRTIKLPQNKIEKIRIIKDYIYYTAAVEGANALERQLFKLKINDELTQE
jgi:hypothetical protein